MSDILKHEKDTLLKLELVLRSVSSDKAMEIDDNSTTRVEQRFVHPRSAAKVRLWDDNLVCILSISMALWKLYLLMIQILYLPLSIFFPSMISTYLYLLILVMMPFMNNLLHVNTRIDRIF